MNGYAFLLPGLFADLIGSIESVLAVRSRALAQEAERCYALSSACEMLGVPQW